MENLKSLLEFDPEKVCLGLEGFIRAQMDRLEREGVILGLSGGIDSSVAAVLCKRAVGADKVLALIMPEKDSEKAHIRDALSLSKELGIETRLVDISRYLKKFGSYKLSPFKVPLPRSLRGFLTKKAYRYYHRKTGETPFSASITGFKDRAFGPYIRKGNASYRIKHRIRMVLLYLNAELENRLVVGAANKTEYRIGFFVKHGCDDDSDIMPIAGLYKTQVRALARYLGLPENIIEKPPSPDVTPGITDEEAIGMPYEQLDLILAGLENGWDDNEIAGAMRIGQETILHVKELTIKSEHMRHVYFPDPVN